jgi:DNA-binding NtrC family response regulator
MNYLVDYHWPGNVRELENLMERLIILRGEGEITPDDLPDQVRARRDPSLRQQELPATGLSFKEAVDELECHLILQALERTHWNKNKAAQLLGLNRTTLLEKIRKKGLEPPE